MSDATHIHQLLEQLPQSSMTTRLLGLLDYAVPGEWKNITKFDELIADVTGESDQALIQQVGEKAIALYADPKNGYQRAVTMYQLVNKESGLAGAATMAAKMGEGGGLMSIFSKLTPKPETTQAIDAVCKLGAEFGAFVACNGIPGDGVADFVRAVTSYAKDEKMRLAAFVAFDCVLPLGPTFLDKLSGAANKVAESSLFGGLSGFLPGGNQGEKVSNLARAVSGVGGSLTSLATSANSSPASILGKVKGVIDANESRAEYVAAAIDVATNVFEHTGIQTVARRVVTRAYNEI
jgi:hypothetical protein